MFNNFNPFLNYIGNLFESKQGYVYRQLIPSPVVADPLRILSAQALDGSTVTTFLAQPDVARTIQIVASGAATGNVVITGTNIRNAVITETLALNGTTIVKSTKAFKTVTSIVLPTVGATTLNVGVNNALGLERILQGDEVNFATLNGVYETTRATVVSNTSDVAKNVATLNGTLDGTKDVVVCFVTKEVR